MMMSSDDSEEEIQTIEGMKSSFSELTRPIEGHTNKISPHYYGRKLEIDEDIIENGLAAISIRHRTLVSQAGQTSSYSHSEKCEQDHIFHSRNSFLNLHKPDLSRLYCTPKPDLEESEDFFRSYVITYGILHENVSQIRNRSNEDEMKPIVTAREELYKDEDIPNYGLLSHKTVQFDDSDLTPSYIVHRSPAEFCLTIGSFTKRVSLKKYQRIIKSENTPQESVSGIIRRNFLTVQNKFRSNSSFNFCMSSSSSINMVTSVHSIEMNKRNCTPISNENNPLLIKAEEDTPFDSAPGIFCTTNTSEDVKRTTTTNTKYKRLQRPPYDDD